jgi:site-specific recombinase XerD
MDHAHRILSIPSKRWERKLIDFLTREEVDAILGAPNQNNWIGKRDYTWILLTVRTGLRVSELTGLCCSDVFLKTGAHIRCCGKGRKERSIPLGKSVASVIKVWMDYRNGKPSDPLFPNNRGEKFSRDGIEYLLSKYVAIANKKCPSLKKKSVSPHVLRHTTAVDLLQSGVERTVISLWLGHESPESTQVYIDVDLAFKEKILAKAFNNNGKLKKFKASDKLLSFLNSL